MKKKKEYDSIDTYNIICIHQLFYDIDMLCHYDVGT